ncbi:MAG: hypothetical protein LBJ16_00445 [Holosporaceae bacterium]|nr:hypothetical protein [Holosporaceae bacterium]
MVHEDPSTEATQKLPKERMFRKKSTAPGFSRSACLADWLLHLDAILL